MGDDFDFEANTQKFNKEQLFAQMTSGTVGGTAPAVAQAYDKDDFFDSISCEATDRAADGRSRNRYSEMRRQDNETFGGMRVDMRNRPDRVPQRSNNNNRGGQYGQGQGQGQARGGQRGGRGGQYGQGQGQARGGQRGGRGGQGGQRAVAAS